MIPKSGTIFVRSRSWCRSHRTRWHWGDHPERRTDQVVDEIDLGPRQERNRVPVRDVPVIYIYLDRIDRRLKRRLEPHADEVDNVERPHVVAAE